MRAALVSFETNEAWALIDLRPDEDAVIASRFAVCRACGLVSAVPAGSLPDPGERWATLADLPEVLRQ
jgi:hypothetical protein